jgi:hypothetical protein
MTGSIPKVIRYCWFGSKPKPPLVLHCIESWKKHCPDWGIVEVNDEALTSLKVPYFIQHAIDRQKWAFVADYFRFYCMFRFGGFTLDADVELLKPLDPFCSNSFVSGQEINHQVLITAVMGAQPNHPFCEMVLNYYDIAQFDGRPNTKFLSTLLSLLVVPKQPLNGRYPKPLTYTFDQGRALLFPQEVFCPYNHRTRTPMPTEKTVAIHHFNGSWK